MGFAGWARLFRKMFIACREVQITNPLGFDRASNLRALPAPEKFARPAAGRAECRAVIGLDRAPFDAVLDHLDRMPGVLGLARARDSTICRRFVEFGRVLRFSRFS